MAKDSDLLELEGEIVKVLPNNTFRVLVQDKYEITCYTSGKMRQFKIKMIVGDKVRVDEGQPAPERKKNQASDDSDASSSIFGRATSLIDHRLQEREAKVAAIASAAERKAAAEAGAVRMYLK